MESLGSIWIRTICRESVHVVQWICGLIFRRRIAVNFYAVACDVCDGGSRASYVRRVHYCTRYDLSPVSISTQSTRCKALAVQFFGEKVLAAHTYPDTFLRSVICLFCLLSVTFVSPA